MNITQDLNQSTFNLISKLLSSPVSFHTIFAEVGGGATEGLFLSQLFHWTNAIKDGEKWLERTYQQWHEFTYLTRRELDAARKKLKALGILEEKKIGSKQNILYKLDVSGLFKLIVNTCNLSTNILDQPVTVESGFPDARVEEVKQLELLPAVDSLVREITRPLLEIPVVIHAPEEIVVASEKSLPVIGFTPPIVDCVANENLVELIPVITEYQPLPLQQTYSSTQKFEDKWKPKPLQPWRTSLGKHQYKPEIVKYLKDIYLPKTPFYEGKEVTSGETMRWIAAREYDEKGLALIEAMMIDYEEYITSPAANAARVLEEISNLPSWVKTSWSWVKTQYKEYLECQCDLSKFHYTKSQTEIDVWELWISKTFPDNFPNMIADKNKMLSSLRSVA